MKKQVGVAYPPDHGWMLPNSETLNVGSLYEDGNVYLFTLPPGSSVPKVLARFGSDEDAGTAIRLMKKLLKEAAK